MSEKKKTEPTFNSEGVPGISEEEIDERLKSSLLFSFSEPQGTGTMNVDPETREKIRRHIEWVKACQNMSWTLGKKPIVPKINP